MSNSVRKIQRKMQKNKGTFIHKKAVAKKLGISVPELNHRLKLREEKLKAMEGANNGRE